MDRDRPLDEWLARALAQPAGSEREAWLERTCGDRPEFLAKLRRLIQAHEGLGPFLERPLVGPWPDDEVPPPVRDDGTGPAEPDR